MLAESPSAELPEADLDPRLLAIEKFDRFAQQRNKLRALSKRAGEWAGLPIGIDGEELVVDPSYRWSFIFNEARESREKGKNVEGLVFRNILWSRRFRCTVAIYMCPDGKVRCQPLIGSASSVDMEMRTMGCSVAWGIEQEATAQKLLATLLRHHMFKFYLMTGQFLETSKRSGVTYMFRRLRPTLALKEQPDGKMHILAAMCMHPIGYYQYTWAGAMCPTDDVIAHLMLMRGDEPMFWRRCNQHPAGRPESGI